MLCVVLLRLHTAHCPVESLGFCRGVGERIQFFGMMLFCPEKQFPSDSAAAEFFGDMQVAKIQLGFGFADFFCFR